MKTGLMLTASLIGFASICALMWIKPLGGQPMNEEKMMKLMKEFVALLPDEVPGFNTRGGIVERVNTKWGVVGIDLLQGLYREERHRVAGRSSTHIRILASLLPERDTAYQVAVLFTESQLAPIGQPGMPEGSWSGLPLGEKVWSMVPKKIGEAPIAHLTVWDDKIAVNVSVEYQRPTKWIEFTPIDPLDLELGELAARLIITKANLVLLGWRELPELRLVANGKTFEAKKSKEGVYFVPAKALLEEMGGKAERKLGVILAYWKGQKVTLPIGAREMIVGKEKVALSLPILWDGKEAWVEGAGFAKGLGLALKWEKGQLVLAKR